jgi:hypothetical protein
MNISTYGWIGLKFKKCRQVSDCDCDVISFVNVYSLLAVAQALNDLLLTSWTKTG